MEAVTAPQAHVAQPHPCPRCGNALRTTTGRVLLVSGATVFIAGGIAGSMAENAPAEPGQVMYATVGLFALLCLIGAFFFAWVGSRRILGRDRVQCPVCKYANFTPRALKA